MFVRNRWHTWVFITRKSVIWLSSWTSLFGYPKVIWKLPSRSRHPFWTELSHVSPLSLLQMQCHSPYWRPCSTLTYGWKFEWINVNVFFNVFETLQKWWIKHDKVLAKVPFQCRLLRQLVSFFIPVPQPAWVWHRVAEFWHPGLQNAQIIMLRSLFLINKDQRTNSSVSYLHGTDLLFQLLKW